MAFSAKLTKDSPFVLVLDAGTDRGYRLARALLVAGNCVVAVDRNAAGLARIGHGHSSAQLFLIAADTTDPAQVEQVMTRAHAHFGAAAPTLALCADYRRSSAA